METRQKTILRTLCSRTFSHSLGQKRKCPGSRGTSVLPSGADIVSLPRHVRFVPIREVGDIIRSPRRHARAAMMEQLIRVLLAVLRSIASWYFVGACAGRLASFSPFEDVSHRGVVAEQDFDDHRHDGGHSSSIHSLGIRGRALAYGD